MLLNVLDKLLRMAEYEQLKRRIINQVVTITITITFFLPMFQSFIKNARNEETFYWKRKQRRTDKFMVLKAIYLLGCW